MNPTTKVADLKDTDLKFAINVGVRFFTPEQMFWTDLEKEAVKRGPVGGELPDFSDYQRLIKEVIEAELPKKIMQEVSKSLSKYGHIASLVPTICSRREK
jgi:hypothetical protein